MKNTYPRATKSMDGIKRFNIHVRHRVDGINLVLCAMYMQRNNQYEEIKPKATRKEWLNDAKSALKSEGHNVWASVEELPDSILAEFKAKAKELFPELFTT